MKTYLLSFLFISISITTSFAQGTAVTSGIKGVVTDDTGPVSFATVLLLNSSDQSMIKAAYTEDDGSFVLPVNTAGSYILKVSFVGYDDYMSEPIDYTPGNVTDLPAISLSTQSQKIEEVVVTAKRPMIEVKPDRTVFNVEGSTNAQGENALALLRKAPGVVVDNNDNIQLLGKSGVQVYIDGRPSPLSADDLAAFLQTIQANDIDNIEIITNPSAKYEAQGNAGIINIKLKKNKNFGTNGSVSFNGSQGEFRSASTSVNLNYRNKKTNLFGNYTIGRNENESFINLRRDFPTAFFDQRAINQNEDFNNNFKAGLDYYASSKSTFGVLVTGFISDGDNLNSSLTDISVDRGTEVLEILDASNDQENQRSNFNFNANYRFDNGSGTTVNVDADYGRFDFNSFSFQPNIYLTGDGQTSLRQNTFGQDQLTDIDISSIKIDYETQKEWGTLGIGGKISNVLTGNDFEFLDFPDDTPGNGIRNDAQSNDFSYEERVTAVYTTYTYGKQKWNVQLGMRMEHTNSNGILTSTQQNTENKRDYTDFFPNAGVTYNVNQKNVLRLSYGRRLDRPNYQDLNPFEFRVNELSFAKGNPNLNPQYTQNIQLGHTYNYRLNTTLSFSETTDLITRLTDTADVIQSFITWENLSTQRTYSINVSYPFNLSQKWNVYANLSGVRTENRSTPGDSRFTEEKNVNLDANTFNMYAQSSYRLPKGFSLELSGYYSSPGIWGGNFETQEYWNVDFGVQKKLFEERATLTLGVSDIFRSQEWEAQNVFGDLRIDGEGGYDSRRFKVGFTYNFGSDTVKKSRRRQTGLDSEQKRTQSGGGIGG